MTITATPKQIPDTIIKIPITTLNAPTDFIVDSNFPGINAVLSDVIPEMINSVAFGNSSVEEALTKAQEATQKIVDKYNK